MAQRKRVIAPVSPVKGKLREIFSQQGGPPPRVTYYEDTNKAAFALLNGIQITESQNHAAWKKRIHGSFKGDVGGNFTSTKRYMSTNNLVPITLSGSEFQQVGLKTYRNTYFGPFLPLAPSFLQFPSFANSSESVLAQLGTTAIARCSPSNATADLSTMLGELMREGIPDMILSTLKGWANLSVKERRRAIGHEHLNLEFGWLPLTRDLSKAAQAILDADAVIKQYERDSGKLVRRQYHFKEVKSESITKVATDVAPWLNPSSSVLRVPQAIPKGYVLRNQTVSKNQWFSGAFTYYVPPRDSWRNSMAKDVILAKKLLGLTLTPDVVWNLAPWSWLIDWVSNAGDSIQNWSNWAIDNQVLAYGYIMEHTVSKNTYTFVGDTTFQSSHVRPPDVEMVSETKIRRQATPYGFGISWAGLSPRQLAILASLGISRS